MLRKRIEVHLAEDMKKVDEFLASGVDVKSVIRYDGIASTFYEFFYYDRPAR